MRANESKFQAFKALHADFFVIPPTWDVMSAVALHATGIPAIATSSVSVGFARGVSSEEVVSFDELLELVRAITDAVDIQLSIDMETGYAETTQGLEENTRRLIDAGIVGLNLEDNSGKPGDPLIEPERHAEKIQVIRRTAESEGVDLFINARTDAYWIKDGVPAGAKTEDSIRRGNHYLAAGADGVFVSGPKIPEREIEPLAQGIQGPLNMLMQADWPALEELRRRGIRRLSLGSWHLRAVFGFMLEALGRLHKSEDLGLMWEYAKPTPVIDKMIYGARPVNGGRG